jgi:hypothetical protein
LLALVPAVGATEAVADVTHKLVCGWNKIVYGEEMAEALSVILQVCVNTAAVGVPDIQASTTSRSPSWVVTAAPAKLRVAVPGVAAISEPAAAAASNMYPTTVLFEGRHTYMTGQMKVLAELEPSPTIIAQFQL